jgi:hypothetical protein
VGNRCHWVLFNNGKLENVSYAIRNEAFRVEGVESDVYEERYRLVSRFARLRLSTNIREYLDPISTLLAEGVALNGYLNLRQFALKSGLDELRIKWLENNSMSSDQFRFLEEKLAQPLNQRVYLKMSRYWYPALRVGVY